MSDGHVILKIEGDDSGLRETLDTVAAAAGEMAEGVTAALLGIDGVGAGLAAAQGTAAGITAGTEVTLAAAKSLEGKITSALYDVDGHGAGMNAALGVASGIAAGTGAAVAAAANLANQVANAMRSALGIRSPSKVAEEIALYFDAGLVEGLLGGARDVSDAARITAAGIVSSMQAGLGGMEALPGLTAGLTPGAPFLDGGQTASRSGSGYSDAPQRVVIDFAAGSDAKRLFAAYVEEGERLLHG